MAKVNLNVNKMTDEQVSVALGDIYNGLCNCADKEIIKDFEREYLALETVKGMLDHDADNKRVALDDLISHLDDADAEDMFGTEGWKHYFDME